MRKPSSPWMDSTGFFKLLSTPWREGKSLHFREGCLLLPYTQQLPFSTGMSLVSSVDLSQSFLGMRGGGGGGGGGGGILTVPQK